MNRAGVPQVAQPARAAPTRQSAERPTRRSSAPTRDGSRPLSKGARPTRPPMDPVFVLLALLFGTLSVSAQPTPPRIGYVYPAGGRQGSTFQVTVGGQSLGGATNAFVSGSGAQARVIEYTRPLTQKEFMDLREKLKELQDQRAAASKRTPSRAGENPGPASTNVWTAADEARLAEVRKKLANPPNRQANPAIAERVTIEMLLAPDAEPGERDFRLGTLIGLSNPLRFHVGQLPESAKAAAKPNPEAGRLREARGSQRPTAPPTESEVRITLPAVVNGQIMPGAVDRFRFSASKGQRVVLAAAARSLIPYLPDAVPGWFQATLTLRDAKGKEVAYADDDRFHPDPVLGCDIPADGEYVIEIKDAIYRGREDFVYRLTVGELPFLTGVFPLGGTAGAPSTVELRGWNLPAATLRLDEQTRTPGLHWVAAGRPDRRSNRVPFAVNTLLECGEKEPNDLRENAQTISLPMIVNGRIDRPGDTDVFRFEGRSGDAFVAEVDARRLDSPLDSTLKLTDAAGGLLAFNDDHEDKGAGLTTHHADSRLSTSLPADGTYVVQLSDAQSQGGVDYAYRLRLSPPQPDFELRVVPSTINARAGAHVPLTVYALRRDGFTNEITLALKDARRGYRLSGARVPSNQDQVRLTLTVAAAESGDPVDLHLEGRATVQGREIVRPAVPAEDLMQAFAYRHLVPAKELKAAVVGRAAAAAGVTILGENPVELPAGGTAKVLLRTPVRGLGDRFKLELSEPPDGIAIESVAPTDGGTAIILRCDATKVAPGFEGNLIVTAFAVGGSGTGRPAANPRRTPAGTLPAIPFEIVAPHASVTHPTH